MQKLHMLVNYLKTAFRNLLRHKAFSVINIAGLGIGMACSIFILLWVRDELSYDQFHENAGQIYRFTCNAGDFKAAVSPAGMAEGLKSGIPAIKNITRISKPQNTLFQFGNYKFLEKRLIYADSNFLEMFDFPLLQGDPKTALQNPYGILISLLAFLLAILLVWALIPAFNIIADKGISLLNLDPKILLSLLGLSLATGLISGIYPAIYLSGFNPAKVLKGKLKSTGGNLVFRNTLVVTQFVVSIVLLVGTGVVNRQLHFIKNMNLGFEKRNLVYIHMTGELWNKMDAIKSELKQNPLTSDYSIISDLPTELITGTVDIKWEGKDPKSQIVFPSMDVDENFINVFQMNVLNGRSFSNAFKGDSSNYVVNEKAAGVMGMTVKNAVGKQLSFGSIKGTIIGVVKNFNFKPVQHPIEPLILRQNKYGSYILVRTKQAIQKHPLRPSQKFVSS